MMIKSYYKQRNFNLSPILRDKWIPNINKFNNLIHILYFKIIIIINNKYSKAFILHSLSKSKIVKT